MQEPENNSGEKSNTADSLRDIQSLNIDLDEVTFTGNLKLSGPAYALCKRVLQGIAPGSLGEEHKNIENFDHIQLSVDERDTYAKEYSLAVNSGANANGHVKNLMTETGHDYGDVKQREVAMTLYQLTRLDEIKKDIAKPLEERVIQFLPSSCEYILSLKPKIEKEGLRVTLLTAGPGIPANYILENSPLSEMLKKGQLTLRGQPWPNNVEKKSDVIKADIATHGWDPKRVVHIDDSPRLIEDIVKNGEGIRAVGFGEQVEKLEKAGAETIISGWSEIREAFQKMNLKSPFDEALLSTTHSNEPAQRLDDAPGTDAPEDLQDALKQIAGIPSTDPAIKWSALGGSVYGTPVEYHHINGSQDDSQTIAVFKRKERDQYVTEAFLKDRLTSPTARNTVEKGMRTQSDVYFAISKTPQEKLQQQQSEKKTVKHG
ncbi:MAG: hypothetical protein V4568_11955 [Pseudomonadota bacterium]